MPTELTAVVLDLDLAENIGPGGLAGLSHGRPDLRFQDSEPAFRGSISNLAKVRRPR